MKRYRIYCTNGAQLPIHERDDGEWVKWEDVVQMLFDLQNGKPVIINIPFGEESKWIVGSCEATKEGV